MSDQLTPEDALTSEDDVLAAELVLRLLGEAELNQARAREAADPAFAAAVAGWNARLMPWLDAIVPVGPDERVWERIVAQLPSAQVGGNVVALKRKVFSWRDAGFALAGIAASLLVMVGVRSTQDAAPVVPSASRSSDLAVAAVAPEGGAAALAVVSYDRVGASLIVTPAALAPLPVGSHELWVVPALGAPKSLGLIAPGPARRIVLADDLATAFAGEPTIAISSEQQGGSRTGLPVGPIVATGKLNRV